MASQNETQFLTFIAGAALEPWRFVKMSGATDRTVAYCGAGEDPVGVTQERVAINEKVSVRSILALGTFKIEASEAMATLNALIYVAASGKAALTGTDKPMGRVLETASADGSIVEYVPVPTDENTAGGTATSVVTGIIRLDALADNTATAVLEVTCPNIAAAAMLEVTMLGFIDAQESVVVSKGLIAFERNAGAALVGTAATVTLAAVATTAAGETVALGYAVAAVAGAVGVANTMGITVTLNTSAASAADIIIDYRFVNAEAGGMTIAAA